MKRPTLRAFLLTVLLLAFLVSAPVLLLNASGYRIDVQKRRLVQTGAVAVSAFPLGASASINGTIKRGDVFSPTLLFTDILPGKYTLSVKDERGLLSDWTKTVDVDPGKTVSFSFARLFPRKLPALFASFPRAPRGILPRSKDFLGWDQKSIFSNDLVQTELQSVIAGDIARVEQLEDQSLLVQFANGSYALVTTVAGTAASVLPVPQSLRDVLLILGNRLVGRDEAGNIFLIQLTPEGLALTPYAQRIAAFAAQDNVIAYLDESGFLWTMREDGSNKKQRTVAPLENIRGSRLFVGRDGDFVLALDQKNTAWLFDNDRDRFFVITDGVTSAEFSSDNEKLLLVTPHEAMLFALRERLDQPRRDKGSLETVARLGEQIISARLLPPESEHAAIMTPSGLLIVEFDGRGGRNEVFYSGASAFTVQKNPARLIVSDATGAISAIPIPAPGLLGRIGPSTPQ